MTKTEELARFIGTYSQAVVPAEVRERALTVIQDGIGALLAAANPNFSTFRHITAFVEELGGKPEATVVGAGLRTHVVNAVLANGTLGYACDMEPHHPEGILHPIAVMVPTALAVAEREGAAGRAFIDAVTVCRLVDEGRLTFDARLRDCVSADLPHFAPEITVEHLLTHSSGITSYFEEDVDPDYEALWRDRPMYRVRGPGDFLPLFGQGRMKFRPGDRFDYNDGGYILLGLVIEAVAGRSFPDCIQDYVFDPAGMEDSGYFATDQLPDRTAYAYIRNADGSWRTNFFAVPIVGAPDGGAYTTAPDMARFWRALAGNRLLTAETTEALVKTRIATGSKPPHTHYGYGVWIDEGSRRKVFVEGSDPGVALRSAFYADQNLVFTIIGNSANALWPVYRELEGLLALS